MKVKDAYLYHAIALTRLVGRITDELYAAEFEAEAPDLSAEERQDARVRIDILKSQLAAYKFMECIGERYETDF